MGKKTAAKKNGSSNNVGSAKPSPVTEVLPVKKDEPVAPAETAASPPLVDPSKAEADRKLNEEAEQKAKEEVDRLAKEQADRKLREDAARGDKIKADLLAKEEADRKLRAEAERIAKTEAERLAKEEADRKLREEAERREKQKADLLAKEEADRKLRDEAERSATEEADRLAKEETDRNQREEAERRAKEDADRLAKEAVAAPSTQTQQKRDTVPEDVVIEAPKDASAASDSTEAGEAFKIRGNELLKEGKAADAIEAYTLAIDADPTDAVFWSNRAQARLKYGDFAGAQLDAEEAIRLRPNWSKAHYRRVTALKFLERPREAALACNAGLEAVAGCAEDTEVKELKKMKGVMAEAAAFLDLQGWWHGTVSATLGGYGQEFCFQPDDKLTCAVYGDELAGSYTLHEVEVLPSGGLRGGIDVKLGDETKVPYLFRVSDGDGCLHLCCPMSGPELRPRSFDGPGYVKMTSGRESEGVAAEMKGLSEGKRIAKYLNELADVLDAKPMPKEGDRSEEAVEKLEEMKDGGIMHGQSLMGQQRLEDKAEKLAYEQRLGALRIKYGGDIEDAGRGLVEDRAKAAKAYPEEAQELNTILRRFGKQKPAVKDTETAVAPAESSASGAAAKEEAPVTASTSGKAADSSAPAAAPAPTPAAAAQPKASPTTAEILGLTAAPVPEAPVPVAPVVSSTVAATPPTAAAATTPSIPAQGKKSVGCMEGCSIS